MRDTPRNTRSIVIGTLLALLSATCLVAFTLLAGSTDYPTGPRVAALEPTTTAAPVTLTARSKRNSDRPRVRPGRENDPTAPIVLGVRITDPDPSGESRDKGRGEEQGRDLGKDPRGSKGSSKPSKDSGDKDSHGSPGSPPQVARPTTQPPEWDDDHAPRGHAYGHDKKDKAGSTGYSSSSKGGPPAHAQANGHDKHSSPVSEPSTGPPEHAQSEGDDTSSEASSTGGPPEHAQANGHDKH